MEVATRNDLPPLAFDRILASFCRTLSYGANWYELRIESSVWAEWSPLRFPAETSPQRAHCGESGNVPFPFILSRHLPVSGVATPNMCTLLLYSPSFSHVEIGPSQSHVPD